MSINTTTPSSDQAPAPMTLRQTLRERPGLRYVLIGVSLLIIAVSQMLFAGTPASSGHYIIAGIGLVLIVTGAATRTIRPRR